MTSDRAASTAPSRLANPPPPDGAYLVVWLGRRCWDWRVTAGLALWLIIVAAALFALRDALARNSQVIEGASIVTAAVVMIFGSALVAKAWQDFSRGRYNARLESLLDGPCWPEWEPSVTVSRVLYESRWHGGDLAPTPALRRPSWREMPQRLSDAVANRPATLVDVELYDQCRSLSRPEHLLEAESILSTPRPSRGTIVVASAFGLTGLIVLAVGWLSVPLMLIGFVLIGQAFGFLCTWCLDPWLRRLWPAPIAGLGAVIDQRGRRWTVNDSIILVERLNDRMHVEFFGPAGRLRRGFNLENDAGFEALWQRWTHPRPLPDLL